MDKKQPPPPPENDAAALEAAIKRAEAEVARVKEWMASEPRQSGRRPKSTTATVGSTQSPETPSRVRSSTFESNGRAINLLELILSQLKWGGVIALITVILTALGIVITNYRNTQTVVQQIQLNDLDITDPPEGASVGLGQRVRGNTPYPYLNHYLVVTLVRTGSTSIQPALVNPDGTFTGEVRFSDGVGNIAVGEDDEFTVRVLATKEKLDAGNLVTFPDDAKLSRQITVRRTRPTEQLAITVPASGAEVGFDDKVSGTTPFTDVNHYIVVTPLRVGTPYVQDQPASVSNGTFSGRARFGGVNVGVGEQFTVQVVATRSTLAAGPLAKQPADAVVSNSITVTRKQ